MLRLSLQFFAHKKGVGSTKNGRDSESKRLGVKKTDGQPVIAAFSPSLGFTGEKLDEEKIKQRLCKMFDALE
mgnify:CR=1 FL=1